MYLEFLQDQVMSAIQAPPNIDMGLVWFQQDGCPAHNVTTGSNPSQLLFMGAH